MTKLNNIATLCKILIESESGLHVSEMEQILNTAHVRSVYRYISQVELIADSFGYKLSETVRNKRRYYKLIRTHA